MDGLQAAGLDFDDANAVIVGSARRLRTHALLRHETQGDLEQALWSEVMVRVPGYRPERGRPAAYLKCCADSAAASLIRRRKALKRQPPGPIHSLDDLAGENDHRPDAVAPDELQRIDTGIDVRDGLAQCPRSLREIAMSLARVGNFRTMEIFGLSRHTLRTMKRQIRRHLEDSGLLIYSKRANPRASGVVNY